MSATYFILGLLALAIVEIHGVSGNVHQNSFMVGKQSVTEVNLNSFFDKRLPFIRRLIVEKDMDPMQLSDMMVPITNLPGMKTQIHLQRGWLQQLSTIQRTDNVLVRYDKKLLEFDLGLGWDNLDVNFSYTLKYLLGIRKGEVFGQFQNLKVSILGTMDMNNYHVNLRFFKFVDVGRFSLRLEGHVADHFINAVTKFLTVVARERIIRELEYQVVKAIQEKIDEVNDLLPDPMYVIAREIPAKDFDL